MKFEPYSIHNLDFFEACKDIPDKSIQVILTSPPFKDEDVSIDYWTFYDNFMAEVERITIDVAFIFNSSNRLWEICRRYRKPYHILIWNKGPLQYSRRYQPVFCYQFRTSTYNIGTSLFRDVITALPIHSREFKQHQYQDPLYVYKSLLEMLPTAGNLVLDPFCGSGTAIKAAVRTGNKYLGFEIDKDRFEVALESVRTSVEAFI